MKPARLLVFATKGAGTNEEARIRTLMSNFDVEIFPFDRKAKARSLWRILTRLRGGGWALTVMEGTGIAGGLGVIFGRLWKGVPYVVSTGDAVSPFLRARMPFLGPIFGLYERLLCRLSSGVIGWTPYLVGRALTFGAPRAMTAAGWAPYCATPKERLESRARVRQQLGISQDTLVVGIVGSLAWTSSVRYCYGYELVRCLDHVQRADIAVLIIGDGNGRKRLESLAGQRLNRSVFVTGQVPQETVPAYLAAMDLVSLPQSVDGVGSFRYTTKLSEYLAAGLPVITGHIPLAYDFNDSWLWRLPGNAPWEDSYVQALAQLLTGLTVGECRAKGRAVPDYLPEFDRELQVRRVTAFVSDLLDS